jgi:hypothetical protein
MDWAVIFDYFPLNSFRGANDANILKYIEGRKADYQQAKAIVEKSGVVDLVAFTGVDHLTPVPGGRLRRAGVV